MRTALLSLLVAGCSYPTGLAMYETAPTAKFTVDSSTPADTATGVELNAAISVVFTDFPDPATAAFPSVAVRSGANTVDIAVKVDLIRKAIVIVPRSALTPSTQYVVELATVQNAAPITSLSRAALGGAKLGDVAVTIRFTTGTVPGTGPMPPPAYTLAKDIQPLFDQMTAKRPDACSSQNGCHAPGIGGGQPQDGLDLRAGMSSALLVGVAAFGEPSEKRVAPKQPENSYLLRKLLGTPDIKGSAMPLGETDAWDPANTQMISDWIAGGAAP